MITLTIEAENWRQIFLALLDIVLTRARISGRLWSMAGFGRAKGRNYSFHVGWERD